MVRLLVVLLALSGCEDLRPALDRSGALYYEVTFDRTEGLTEEDKAPFNLEWEDVALQVVAYGHDRELLEQDVQLTVRVTPGEVESAWESGLTGAGEDLDDPRSTRIELVGGVANAVVRIRRSFDQTRIWVSDEGRIDRSGVEQDIGSFASGVAPLMWFRKPTISEMQSPANADQDSALVHSYVPLRGWVEGEPDPRDLRVTSVLNDGFYVTDYSSPPGSYRSLFVFTFSRPEGVVVGQQLAGLSGIVGEYIGFTELQFPDWIVSGPPIALPAPLELDPSIVCDDVEMERYESEVVHVTLPASDFRSAGECDDYVDHGQWPAALPGTCGGSTARITVVNVNTVPCYQFPECEVPRAVEPDEGSPFHPPLTELTGVLRHTAPADPPWILDVRSCLDFNLDELPESCDCEQLMARPLSGPRKAPHKYYRDIASCDGTPYTLHPRLSDN